MFKPCTFLTFCYKCSNIFPHSRPIENLMESSISFTDSKMISCSCILMIRLDGVHYMFRWKNKLETLFVWIETRVFKSSIHNSIVENQRFVLQPKRPCSWTIANNVLKGGSNFVL